MRSAVAIYGQYWSESDRIVRWPALAKKTMAVRAHLKLGVRKLAEPETLLVCVCAYNVEGFLMMSLQYIYIS